MRISRMKAAMERYERAINDGWRVEDEQTASRKQVDACLSEEKRSWSQKVARLVKRVEHDGGLKWGMVEPDVHVVIDHGKRPMQASWRVRVKVWNSHSHVKGHVELSGWGVDRDAVLQELERVLRI